MALIKKPTELVIPSTIKMMVYGQAGSGKTTVALSAPKPLLLDFDNGVRRVNMNHLDGVDIVQVESWNDIKQLMVEDLSAYQTIVVDTVGKMMDYIIAYVCGNRQPQIKEWGKVNQEFTWFVRAISNLNKNVIFVAHRDTRKEGDDTIFVPSLREKSYNAIVTELDLLGYLEMRSEQGVQRRTITFDPTSRNDGKNTCNLPSAMQIPVNVNAQGQPVAPNNFIADSVIKPYHAMLQLKAQESKRYSDLLAQIGEDVELITDAASANDFAARIKEYSHVGSSMAKAREMFLNKVKTLGLVYDKDSKSYTDAGEAA